MNDIIGNLKAQIKRLLWLGEEIAKWQQIQLHKNDMNDRRNYDAEMVNKIAAKVNKLQEEYFKLKEILGV